MLRRTATELEPKCLKWDSRIGQFYRDDAAAVEHDQCTTSDYESEHPELGDGHNDAGGSDDDPHP